MLTNSANNTHPHEKMLSICILYVCICVCVCCLPSCWRNFRFGSSSKRRLTVDGKISFSTKEQKKTNSPKFHQELNFRSRRQQWLQKKNGESAPGRTKSNKNPKQIFAFTTESNKLCWGGSSLEREKRSFVGLEIECLCWLLIGSSGMEIKQIVQNIPSF